MAVQWSCHTETPSSSYHHQILLWHPKGLLIGHLHRPPHPVGKGSLYSAYYHDQTRSTLYREDLPTPNHSQQHPQNQEAQYNVDFGQSYPSSSHQQDGYLSPNNPVSSQYEVYSTDSGTQDQHNRDFYDNDHYHYPLTDNHLIYDTYTGWLSKLL